MSHISSRPMIALTALVAGAAVSSAAHAAPTQAPFDRNDVRDVADRAASIYHWTPAIRDFADTRQLFDWQLADLDDPEALQLFRAGLVVHIGERERL